MSVFKTAIVLVALAGFAFVAFLFWPRFPTVAVDADFRVTDRAVIARGGYITAAAGCVSCHWDKEGGGTPFAGGRRIASPFGDFISPNITPDQATGIGAWTPSDFLRLMQHGYLPSGQPTFPSFPWGHYRHISQNDALAIYAYLMSLAPVSQAQRGNELPFPLSARPAQLVWRWLFMPASVDVTDRGAYLVHALGHCGACHTPRNALGGRQSDRLLEGVTDQSGKVLVPGLTASTGLGNWSADELDDFLTDGFKPNYDTVEGEMALVIEHGTSRLTAADRAALVAYLKSLP